MPGTSSMENIAREIRSIVGGRLEIGDDINDLSLISMIEDAVIEKSADYCLTLDEKSDISRKVFNSMRRMGILQPLMDDAEITEIMVNGFKDIFIEKKGFVRRIDMSFPDEGNFEDIIQVIVSKVNKSVSEASPIVDARLEDGSRINVVLPPIAINGPIMTIRKFPETPMNMEDLVSLEFISMDAAEFLKTLVRAKYNIFICGGTGSGKTTFLNTLANCIPPEERIVTIEDSAELRLDCIQNIVRLETRNANYDGKGKITIGDLIRASLRMRPERIIVGEVRGPEALDMLQAMNTGHDGSMSTGHSNSAADILSRLETMVISAASLPLQAVRQYISSAVEVIVFISRMRDRSRKIIEISEVAGLSEGTVELNPIYAYRESNHAGTADLNGTLVRTGSALTRVKKLQMAGLTI